MLAIISCDKYDRILARCCVSSYDTIGNIESVDYRCTSCIRSKNKLKQPTSQPLDSSGQTKHSMVLNSIPTSQVIQNNLLCNRKRSRLDERVIKHHEILDLDVRDESRWHIRYTNTMEEEN